jgi:hypothetical protein
MVNILVCGKNQFTGFMELIDENDLLYVDEGKIDDTERMETFIILLQIF